MQLNKLLLAGVLISLVGCANPLNKVTYQSYWKEGAIAEKQMDVATAEFAYSRALGNVYIGNLGPEKEAEALFNLGRLERLNGKLDLSLEHLLKSLEIDENINHASPTLLKSTMGEIAKTYYDKEQYQDGIPYLDKLNELGKGIFRSAQSKRFILKIYSDYAKKLEEIGLTEKAKVYHDIASM